MEMRQKIHTKFSELFGESGTFYAAAGRVNLIGEHTDYNGGYVFPGAIDKGIMAEIKKNGSATVNLFSIDYNESTSPANTALNPSTVPPLLRVSRHTPKTYLAQAA